MPIVVNVNPSFKIRTNGVKLQYGVAGIRSAIPANPLALHFGVPLDLSPHEKPRRLDGVKFGRARRDHKRAAR